MRLWGKFFKTTAAAMLGAAVVLGMEFGFASAERPENRGDAFSPFTEVSEELTARKMGFGFPGLVRNDVPVREDALVNGPGDQILGGGSILLLANQTASQMMSVVMETSQGSIIVIDGGKEGDAYHLLDVLRARGGHVAAWFITHPHSDHVGALTKILKNPYSQVTIDNIYYSLAEQSWYETNESYRADMVETFRESVALLPPKRVHGDIRKGQVIWIDDVSATVLNEPYLFEKNSINNSSVAYRFVMNGVSILFLGDMGQEAGERLLAETPPELLKSDIVQMAHHGQYGVGREVYGAIRPQICLWPTPGWLWDNDNGGGEDSGPWFTKETRRWMEEIGGTVNYCIKDGDKMIR